MLTVSDRAAAGEYQDEGGPSILHFYEEALRSATARDALRGGTLRKIMEDTWQDIASYNARAAAVCASILQAMTQICALAAEP